MADKKDKKSLADLLEDASEILKNSTNLIKIKLIGKKTNIIIEKDSENDKD